MRALALAVLLSCASRAPEVPQAQFVLDAPLVASTANLGGMKVLVDTGATVHAVRRAGGAPKAKVLDAHGAPLDAERLAASPIPNVGGPWFGVAGLPVAALVSPRAMLSPGQAAELDLRSRHFRIHDDPRIGASLVAAASVRADALACGLYAIDAKLGGNAVRLLVDSGSARTTLLLKSPTTPAFRKWKNYPATLPDPTGNHSAWVVLNVPVSIAGLETDIDLVVADDPDEPCPVDGTVGMDLLERCNFVLMRGVGGLSCE